MKLWICCKHISEIIEITTCRETSPESLLNAQFEQISWKKIIVILLFVLLNKYCLHDYKNVFISNSGPVTNKVLLFLLELEIRMTFKYTGCTIFLNSEKHNESNCTKKKRMLPLKKIKLTLNPWKGGLLRATFYIQFIVLFEFFNLIYYSLKSDVK
jgi:hypothetical protein